MSRPIIRSVDVNEIHNCIDVVIAFVSLKVRTANVPGDMYPVSIHNPFGRVPYF